MISLLYLLLVSNAILLLYLLLVSCGNSAHIQYLRNVHKCVYTCSAGGSQNTPGTFAGGHCDGKLADGGGANLPAIPRVFGTPREGACPTFAPTAAPSPVPTAAVPPPTTASPTHAPTAAPTAAFEYDLTAYPHSTQVTDWYGLHWRVDATSQMLKLALVVQSTVRNHFPSGIQAALHESLCAFVVLLLSCVHEICPCV
jgi:hypothetical protein